MLALNTGMIEPDDLQIALPVKQTLNSMNRLLLLPELVVSLIDTVQHKYAGILVCDCSGSSTVI